MKNRMQYRNITTRGVQEIERIELSTNHMVGSVGFEVFDDVLKTHYETLVPWQSALAYLRAHRVVTIKYIYWQEVGKELHNKDVGSCGRSWGEWHKNSAGNYCITQAGNPVLIEASWSEKE